MILCIVQNISHVVQIYIKVQQMIFPYFHLYDEKVPFPSPSLAMKLFFHTIPPLLFLNLDAASLKLTLRYVFKAAY